MNALLLWRTGSGSGGRCFGGHPGRVSGGRAALLATLWVLILVLSGCGGASTRVGASTSEAETGAGSRPGALAPPPAPPWGREGTGSASRPKGSGRDVRPNAASGAGPYYSRDPLVLRQQVAARCAAGRDYEEPAYLASVVGELYLSAADPALATEALILGDCGSLEAIVRELVAQGGYGVVGAVSARASLLGGAGAQRSIEAAVAAGLDRARATPDASAQVADPEVAPYALAHFSPRSGAATLLGADALNSLYANGIPGFGLYTYVLLSPASGGRGAMGQARSRELLRVIETYVPGGEVGGPGPEVHAFLVAVHPERADLPLAEQTGPELSDPMRRQLAQALRETGQTSLARRLETRPGPFLVSGPEPRLIPEGSASPRLVVDLSGVGSEYLYAIVDAFDQPVPTGSQGAGLDAVRERLLRLPLEGEGALARADAWVFRIKGSANSRVSRR